MNDNLNEKGLLPLEDLIKALDEKGIEYDKREISDAYFPLKDVEACLNDTNSSFVKLLSEPYIKNNANRRACPLCGKPSEELKWICFKSPQWTWQNLSGRGGPMSICPDCRCIVEFICVVLN